MGELLLQAFSTVVIGMGVVFAVLILISYIINSFKIISYLEKKIADRKNRSVKTDVEEITNANPDTSFLSSVTTGITNEEIAAIAAAIEAYTGMSQSDFIVRRIVRR